MLPKALPALLLVFSAVSATPQQPTSFEVASVRPSDNNDSDGSWSPPGTGKFTAHNLSLQWLIMLAFGIDADQIANKPSWLASDHFEVEARTAGNVSLSREEQKPLLQALLRERFHLATHTEVRQMSGYALTLAKTGSKLHPTKGARFPNYRLAVSDHQLSGLNWSMSYLAMLLQHPAGRPVVDRTGLTGGYDIDLKFAPDTPTEEVLPSVFTAVQTTLGLKLEPQSVPVEFLVIDHVDRTPTAN